MLDDAILAGGIHALQHDQHGPLFAGIQTLLHLFEPVDALREERLRLLAIGREVERRRRIVIGEPEPLRLVDPAGFYDFRKLHCRLLAPPSTTRGRIQAHKSKFPP